MKDEKMPNRLNTRGVGGAFGKIAKGGMKKT